MRFTAVGCLSLCFALVASAQSDRGTITGTVSDPAGAIVANAPIEARNSETGAEYKAGTSATGNYTLAQLPVGTYEISVTVPGFKTYKRQNIVVPAAQTLRVDIALEVGAANESVTITAEATLLKTESGELSHNVTTERMDNLPVLSIGASAGTAGIRNPYSVLQLLPGSNFTADTAVRINGSPANTQSLRIEGQDATNGIDAVQSVTTPSVDAIQEFAVQTSNFAAEYGQAGGGLFNVTMRSGTNQYHGSAYDYFVNEALNAGQPFTNNGKGSLLRSRQRRNDYGFSFGGPVKIPRLYDGHDKTFFFFNFEQFRETVIINNQPLTVPTLQYRQGNFSQALTGRVLGTDQLGRPILENQIYNPATTRNAVGLDGNVYQVRDTYPGNIVPLQDMDPVALKIQSLIPLPTNGGLTNNYVPTFTNPKTSTIPSIKLDHSLNANSKISGYYSRTATFSPNANGLPEPITSAVPRDFVNHTIRINYDQTLSPTLLAHLGIGLLKTRKLEPNPVFDPVSQLGLTGTYAKLFPVIQWPAQPQGGGPAMGPGNSIDLTNYKPTANANVTWVHTNHTFKFGAEMRVEGYLAYNQTFTNGWIPFTTEATGLPSLNGVSLPGTVGFAYASFLLGRVAGNPNSIGYTGVPSNTRIGSHGLAFYAQDTWKITRTLTVDYGLRYDFETYLKEQYGRIANFSASQPNPAAGNIPGAVVFEGYGPGRCNCDIAHNYPFAFGPRLGLAYQINPKTVLRLGVGVSYGKPDDNNNLTYSTGSVRRYAAPSYGEAAFLLKNGMPYQVTFPDFNTGQFPFPGTTAGPLIAIDREAGRPPRQVSWSLGLQRELFRDLLVEAAYVGNRGVWWDAPNLINPNALTPQALQARGLDINNPADRLLLNSRLDSALAAQRGFSTPPYAGFPLSATVAQALRPIPQFGSITYNYPPLGDTWYDSLQAKMTKRFSHGLDATVSYSWQKQLTLGVENNFSFFAPITPAVNDIFNRPQNKYLSGYDQPQLLVVAGTYITPKIRIGSGFAGKGLSWFARDWQVGAVLRYGSGLPIRVPTSNNQLATLLFRSTFANRVPGVPLFTQDLNCHCFDPNKTFVLNPAAWTDPPPGQFGASPAYYSDYRYQRRPAENMSLARNFRIRERANLQIRAEFTNIFNRTEVNNPTGTNFAATQTTSNGQTLSGFGYISTATVAVPPRQGQIVARFSF